MSVRELLKEKARPKVVKVEIPGVGPLHLKTPSVAQRGDWIERSGAGDKSVSARLVINTVCDESGVLAFTGDDLDEVSSWDWRVVDAIVAEVARLLGIDDEAIEAAKKKLKQTPSSSGASA